MYLVVSMKTSHTTTVETFHLKPKISTSRWHLVKESGLKHSKKSITETPMTLDIWLFRTKLVCLFIILTVLCYLCEIKGLYKKSPHICLHSSLHLLYLLLLFLLLFLYLHCFLQSWFIEQIIYNIIMWTFMCINFHICLCLFCSSVHLTYKIEKTFVVLSCMG